MALEVGRAFCPKGHSFDFAKSGYLNLLQPQERKSRNPGDSAQAVAARRRLHDLGVTSHVREAIGELLSPAAMENVLDAGCGDGFYLQTVPTASAHGIDISTPAIEAAAKRYPGREWIVCNADRLIPYADRAFTAVLSITARMNPPEFHRVLREDGILIVAIPAPDDLIELRGSGRDRVNRTVKEFSPHFSLSSHRRVSSRSDLEKDAVDDVLHSIYRPLSSSTPRAMHLTFSLDLLLFQPLTCNNQTLP